MSRKKNENLRFYEDLELLARGSEWTVTNSTPTKALCETIAQAMVLWTAITEDILSNPIQFLTEREHPRWADYVCSGGDVIALVAWLKECDGRLLTETSYVPDQWCFKRTAQATDWDYQRILRPVEGLLALWYYNCNTTAFKLLHTFFSFLTRLTLPRKDLEEEALQKYLAIEEELSKVTAGDELNPFFRRLFKPHSLFSWKEDFLPAHGPGSTADAGRSMRDKYLHLGSDPGLRYLGLGPFIGDSRPYQRTSKLHFVPKSATAVRSISMEPATLMWYQQGVLRNLVRFLTRRRSPLKSRFTPEDQTMNRDRAWEGSIDGHFATIDLSSASDSVSWSLVWKALYGTPLLRWFKCTRSTHTLLPSGEVIRLRKFAPMGSALCFPTEVLIFCAIVEWAITRAGGTISESQYCVYGDDIIVETVWAPHVIEALRYFGFTPNESKSFFNESPTWYGFFRESCGGEYLNGDDVSCLRISRRFSGGVLNSHTPSRISALIDLANEANFRFPVLRSIVVKKLLGLPKPLRPLFSVGGEVGLFSTQPTNFHLECKMHTRYQRPYLLHGGVRTKLCARSIEDDEIALYEHLRATSGRARLTWPEDLVNVVIRPPLRVSWSSMKTPQDSTLV